MAKDSKKLIFEFECDGTIKDDDLIEIINFPFVNSTQVLSISRIEDAEQNSKLVKKYVSDAIDDELKQRGYNHDDIRSTAEEAARQFTGEELKKSIIPDEIRKVCKDFMKQFFVDVSQIEV